MKQNYKIVVVGLGYVGLSNAVLLAQSNEVIGVDISQERVDALNARRSPIEDAELIEYLTEKDLNLSASTDLNSSITGADYIIVCTPTNFDENTNLFDTSSVEEVITEVIKNAPSACIIVKSTVPVGFTTDLRERLKSNAIIFSPEFLREGKALYDNLYPSRIVIGEVSKRAEIFANLLKNSAKKSEISILLTGAREAEAIKLFSNTYLAMRIAFFNELDNYALNYDINCGEIIAGVSLDPRIGNYYNNPSFGYGGYCLPKDTKQLLANYDEVPQNLIKAIVASNETRKNFIVDQIMKRQPKTVGVFRLVMKAGSDNFRQSTTIDIMKELHEKKIDIILYEPKIANKNFLNTPIETDINRFKERADIIIANRVEADLEDVLEKVFSRDVFGVD